MEEAIKKEATSIYKELCDKIGVEKVKEDEAIMVSYGFDSSTAPFQKPGLVVLPESTDDVKAVLMTANREKIPVTVMAAGVNVGGMCVPSEGGIVLDFRNMNKILEINTDSGYAIIEPGVIFDRFTAAGAKFSPRGQVFITAGALIENELLVAALVTEPGINRYGLMAFRT